MFFVELKFLRKGILFMNKTVFLSLILMSALSMAQDKPLSAREEREERASVGEVRGERGLLGEVRGDRGLLGEVRGERGSVASAQNEGALVPATAKVQAPLPTTAAKAFKLKAEFRSAQNSFSDKSSVTNFRLRLDPSYSWGDWTLGLRQDIKNRYANGQESYTLESTRAFAGRNYKVDEWQLQARAEAWLPTNVRDREQQTFQGSPGAALKVKRKWLSVTSNFELNARKMTYSTTKNNYADWMIFNELKNEIKISKSLVANLNVKFDDSWDQQGKRSQKYSLEQSVSVNVATNLDLEIGHVVEKPLLATSGKSDSFVGYDKEFSQLYTQINYVY